MSVRTDVVNLTVNVNGNQAQANLNNLRKSAADISFEMKGLKKGTDEYISKSNDLKKVTDQMDALKKEIGLSSLNLRELNNERNKLSAQLKGAVPLSDEFKALDKQLTAVNGRIQEVNGQMSSFKKQNAEHGESIAGELTKGFAVVELIRKGWEVVKEFFSSSLEEADKAEQASSNLRNSLENAGRIDLFGTLTAQAEKFADTFKAINANDVKNVFTKLIDYGKLTETQMTSLTQVIINYAAKQKISLEEATDVLTRSLEGNAKGLRTYGVNIKDATNFSERLGLVLGPLADKVKGAEAALESTNKGAWQVFKENIVKIKEAVGGFLLSLTGIGDASLKNAIAAKQEADQGQTLVARYEELSKKVNKTAADKTELQGITASLTATFGNSVLEIDKETGAMKLNVEATKDLISQKLLLANQKAVELAGKYKASLDDESEATENLTKSRAAYNATVKATGKTIEDAKKDVSGAGLAGTDISKTSQQLIDFDNAIRTHSKVIKDTKDDQAELLKQLKELGFSAAEVNKLIKPDTNKIIGSGDPAGDEAKKQAEKDAKAAKTKYDELKKEADKFYQDVLKLKDQAEIKGEEPEQHEIDAVRLKYQELLDKAKKYYVEQIIGEQKFGEERSLLTEAREKEINAIFQKYYKLRMEKDATDEYEKSLQFTKQYYDQKRQEAAKDYYNGVYDKTAYEEKLKSIESQETSQRIVIAKDYSQYVKKAVTDLATDTKKQEESITKNLELQAEAREKLRKQEEDAIFNLQQAGLKKKNTPESNKEAAEAEARKKAAQSVDQLKKDIAATGQVVTDELLKLSPKYQEIQEELNNALKKINQDFLEAQIDQVTHWVGYFQDALASLNTIINNQENRQLAKDKANSDKKKKLLTDELNHKLISKEQYDKKVQAIDEENDKKSKILARKQAERQKILDLFSAIINTAAAVAKELVEQNYAQAIATGILGGLQIATIASTPLPELGTGDWVRTGDKHSAPSRGIPTLIERDEAVMAANAMTDPDIFTVTGTTAQITSALNGRKPGNANWASGAKIVSMPAWRTEKPASINPNLPRIMEQGGIIRPLSGSATFNSSDEETKALLRRQNQLLEEHIEVTKQKNENIKAVVSIKEYREREAIYDAAKKVSGI